MGVPSAGVRPVGGGDQHADRGAVGTGSRGHAVRGGGIGDVRPSARDGTPPLRRGAARREGLGGDASGRDGKRGGNGRLRYHPRPMRLPGPPVRAGLTGPPHRDTARFGGAGDARGGASDLAGLPERCSLRRHLECRSPSGPALRRDDPPRPRPVRLASGRSGTGYASGLLRPLPSRQGAARGDGSSSRSWHPAPDGRNCRGRSLPLRRCRARHRWRSGPLAGSA